MDVIYFSVNNWGSGKYYPPTENFEKWMGDDLNQMFTNDAWCKENKLCIYYGIIDMSINYTVSASREKGRHASTTPYKRFPQLMEFPGGAVG